MNAPDLVAELGTRLNLTGITLNGGVCRLVFDRRLPIDIEDDGAGNLCFHTVLGPMPHDRREALMTTLLSSHLFGLDTDGAVFGVHPKTGDIYLFRSLPLDGIAVDSALSALERFTQQAETWKTRLDGIDRETPSDGTDAATPASSELLRA